MRHRAAVDVSRRAAPWREFDDDGVRLICPCATATGKAAEVTTATVGGAPWPVATVPIDAVTATTASAQDAPRKEFRRIPESPLRSRELGARRSETGARFRRYVRRPAPAPLAMTTVVQELLNFGRSRASANRMGNVTRSPRTIGQ